MENNNRNSNIELLRIISMFLIFLSHFSFHSEFSFNVDDIKINMLFTQFTSLGGLGVNIFVLISAYFLSQSNVDEFRVFKKILAIWRLMFFYSVVPYFCMVLIKKTDMSFTGILKNSFPFVFDQWWFATTYILMFLFHPFINRLLEGLTKKEYIKLLLLVLSIWVIIPTFSGQEIKCSDLLWFFSLYVMASYIHNRRKNEGNKRSLKYYFLATFGMFFLYCISVIMLDYLSIKTATSNHGLYFANKQRIMIFLMSIFLFIGFVNLKPKFSKRISEVSKLTFGMYLLSENDYIRIILWNRFNPMKKYIDSSVLFIPGSLLYCILIFVFCGIIECIRINISKVLFGRSKLNNIEKKIYDKCLEWWNRFVNEKI